MRRRAVTVSRGSLRSNIFNEPLQYNFSPWFPRNLPVFRRKSFSLLSFGWKVSDELLGNRKITHNRNNWRFQAFRQHFPNWPVRLPRFVSHRPSRYRFCGHLRTICPTPEGKTRCQRNFRILPRCFCAGGSGDMTELLLSSTREEGKPD